MLELRHLRLVRAIAEEGGVTRAGRRLHLTQSALSHQLRDAEERLGARLFDRVASDDPRPPPASASCAPRAASRRARAHRAGDPARRARPGGVLRLTTQCNTVYHWLPSRLRLFHRTHPDVDLQVVAGATDDPFPSLLEGTIDLAIVFRPRPRPPARAAGALPGRDRGGDAAGPSPGAGALRRGRGLRPGAPHRLLDPPGVEPRLPRGADPGRGVACAGDPHPAHGGDRRDGQGGPGHRACSRAGRWRPSSSAASSWPDRLPAAGSYRQWSAA